MSDTVQQIKERLDLIDFMRGYLSLVPAGKNFKALCPFHKEKTPSFIASPDRQMWHCFGCSAGGDVVSFLMRYENLEFIEALKILAEKAGIDIGRVGSQDQRQVNTLYAINQTAKDFFKANLSSCEDDRVKTYLSNRGLKAETIAEFEIGFAPDVSDALTRHLLGLGHNIQLIEKAGLAIKSERGTYFDRFRGRIMFPLHNAFGKAVGFTGRIVPLPSGALAKEGVAPKYLNSPETPVFNKSRLLYGLDKAKNAIRDSRAAILVEGQMDLIMAWQDGIKNVVAASGTAFTADHLKNLKRLADTLVLFFDQDTAGQTAAERTIDLSGSVDLNVKVVQIPQYDSTKPGSVNSTNETREVDSRVSTSWKDPADIALAKPGFLKTLIDNAQPAMKYYLDKYQISNIKNQKLGIAEVKKNVKMVLGKIKNLASPVERAQWLKEMAANSGIEERYLVEEMENIKTDQPVIPNSDQEILPQYNQPPSRKETVSQRIATLVFNHRDFLSEAKDHINYLPASYQRLIQGEFNSHTGDPELRGLADFIHLRSGLDFIPDVELAKTELRELFRQLKKENFKEELAENHRMIEKTERIGGATAELLVQKQAIFKKLNEL